MISSLKFIYFEVILEGCGCCLLIGCDPKTTNAKGQQCTENIPTDEADLHTEQTPAVPWVRSLSDLRTTEPSFLPGKDLATLCSLDSFSVDPFLQNVDFIPVYVVFV